MAKSNQKSNFLEYFPWDTFMNFLFLMALILLALFVHFEINRIDSNINIVYEIAKEKQYSDEIDLIVVVNRTQEIAKGWFNYNMSNVNVTNWEMSASKLHEESGVCRHFSNYYKFLFQDLGFNAKEISMPEINHRVLMVWDNSSRYCIIDQTFFWCQ